MLLPYVWLKFWLLLLASSPSRWRLDGVLILEHNFILLILFLLDFLLSLWTRAHCEAGFRTELNGSSIITTRKSVSGIPFFVIGIVLSLGHFFHLINTQILVFIVEVTRWILDAQVWQWFSIKINIVNLVIRIESGVVTSPVKSLLHVFVAGESWSMELRDQHLLSKIWTSLDSWNNLLHEDSFSQNWSCDRLLWLRHQSLHLSGCWGLGFSVLNLLKLLEF